MFKKALQVVMAFGVLLAGYAGYVRIFAVVASEVGQKVKRASLPRMRSKTEQEAIALAIKGFGQKHWATDPDLPVRYYNHDRRYWMYAQEYKRLGDGKQLRFKPFALISQSGDGKGLKTITADEAVLDLDQPLGLVTNKANSSPHVVHAQIERNVQIRDDRGSPGVLADDLVIGPMTYIEYDEAKLQIRSDSYVVIQDRDLRITGDNLQIDLRSKEEAAPTGSGGGFNGAKNAFLRKNVHIIMNNSGPAGVLPGKPAPATAAGKPGNTPIDLRCAGEMRVDLPRPKVPVRVGPPAPDQPTMVYFNRDVVVLQLKPAGLPPDQLNCDFLHLTLMPTPKPPKIPAAPAQGDAAPKGAQAAEAKPAEAGAAPAQDAPTAEGVGTELALREARATGHAVWLQSKSQGFTARCNELKHKKLLPDEPDETYLRGDQIIRVEKLDLVQEGPDKGKIQSVTTIRTVDATIFDNGQGNDNSTIVARGPGILETRPARDKPVERTAIWQDHLLMQTEQAPDKHSSRKITLTNSPKFIDPAQATLDARDTIVVWLKPKPKPPEAPKDAAAKGVAATASAVPTAGGYEIEKLVALKDVHLKATGKTMTARERLDAEFETLAPPKDPDADAATPAKPGTSAAATAAAPTPEGEARPPATAAEPAAEPKPKPADPDIVVKADRVWAKILMKPGAASATLAVTSTSPAAPGSGRNEVKEVRLRGEVSFHQDPSAGKVRGTDVTGEALDVTSLGEGKSLFQVHYVDPNKRHTKAELALVPHARVATEEMTITGPVIGLNQVTDHAWVTGRGTLTQMAERGLLTDQGLEGPSREARARAGGETKRPLTISWEKEMQFHGRVGDPRVKGQFVGKAEFFEHVRAKMDDSSLACEERMETFMDKVVSLTRPAPGAKPKPADPDAEPREPETKPQIVLIRCYDRVVAVSRKLDPETRALMQQQRIEGNKLAYDKVSGDFVVPGAGKVWLWNRDGEDATAAPGSQAATRRTVTPTANVTPSASNARRGPEMVGRAGSLLPARANVNTAASSRDKVKAKARSKPLPPLKLTLVHFSNGMQGRYVAGKDVDPTEIRWADFFGDVQALNAKVADETVTLDFDAPPDDAMRLTSQTMRVVSEPSRDGSGTARNFLKATVNAHAKTRTETIQADVITYDSAKELFYAYGNEGRQVVITQQAFTGQPVSVGHNDAIRFNRRTHETQMANPSEIFIVDNKTGNRVGPAGDEKIRAPKSTRIPLRAPGRSTIERRGMNGR